MCPKSYSNRMIDSACLVQKILCERTFWGDFSSNKQYQSSVLVHASTNTSLIRCSQTYTFMAAISFRFSFSLILIIIGYEEYCILSFTIKLRIYNGRWKYLSKAYFSLIRNCVIFCKINALFLQIKV